MSDGVNFDTQDGVNFDTPPDQGKASAALRSVDKEADDKLKVAQHFGRLGLSPTFAYRASEHLHKALYGEPGKPATLAEKIKNTWDSWQTGSQIDTLRMKQVFGDNSPDTQKQIDELSATEAPLERQIKQIPNLILNQFYQFGKMGEAISAGGQEAFKQYRGVGHVPFVVASGMFHGVKEFETQIVGGAYHELMSAEDEQGRHMNPGVARATALTLGVVSNILMAVPFGKAVEPLLAKAGTEAAIKLTVGGVVKRVAAAGLTQGAFAAANSLAQEGAKEIAKAVSNRIDGTNLTQDSAIEFLKNVGIGTAKQFAVGMAISVPGLAWETAHMIPGGRMETKVKEAVVKAERAEPKPTPSGSPVEIATTENLSTAKIGDIIEGTPKVPEAPGVKTIESVRMTEEQGAALDKATRSAEGTSDYIEKQPEIEKLNAQIEDLQAQVKAGRTDLQEQLQRAVESKQEAIKSLRTQIKTRQTVNKMVRNIGKVTTEKMPAEFKGPLEDLLKQYNIVRPTESTLSALRDIKTKIDEGALPTDFPQKYISRLDELSKKPLRDLTVDELKIVHDTIMGYSYAGRTAMEIHDLNRTLQAKEAVDQGISEIGLEKPSPGLKDFMVKHPDLTQEEARGRFSEQEKQGAIADTVRLATNVARWAKASNMGYQSMITWMARHAGGEDSMTYRVLAKMVDAGDDVRVAKQYEYIDPIHDWLRQNNLNMSHYLNEKKTFDLPDWHGELEKGQIIALAGLKSTEDGWESLKDGGFRLAGDRQKSKEPYKLSEESLNAIIGTLDKTDTDFINQVFALGQRTGKDMGEVFQRMYGYDLKLLDPYYPIYRVKSELGIPFEEDVIKQRGNNSFVRAGVDKSHTIERVGSTKAVWLRNVGDDIADTVDFASTFVGMGEPVRNASRLLFDSKFADSIRRKYGDVFYDEMTKGLKEIAGTHAMRNAPERFIMNINRRGIGAVLGFNLPTAGINRILVERSLAGYVPARDWTLGQAYVARHPKTTHDYLIEHSPLYRQIAEAGSMTEIRDVMQAKGSTRGLAGVFSKVQRASMKPEVWGFAGATKGEMWSAVTQARRELAAGTPSIALQRAADLADRDGPNLTPEQRDTAAIKYAEYIVKRTHANPREMYKGNITREGIVGALMGTLGSEKNQLLQLGIRMAADIHTPGGGKRMAKYLLVGVLGEALSIAGIRAGYRAAQGALTEAVTGKKTKERPFLEEALRELVTNTVGLIYGTSGAIYSIEQAVTSKGYQLANQSGTLISQFGQDIYSMIHNLHLATIAQSYKARQNALYNAIDDFLSFAVPLVTKVPYKHGIKDVVGLIRKSSQ